MPEVARHEPGRALDGGADGLAAYRAHPGGLPRLLAPDGVAVLELGAGPGGAVAALARAAGFSRDCRVPTWPASTARCAGWNAEKRFGRRGAGLLTC